MFKIDTINLYNEMTRADFKLSGIQPYIKDTLTRFFALTW